jgi:macrodomain Ter protein organizer (MatP/YcbG family)
MPTTNIEVDTTLWDRLVILAQDRGMTVGDLLADLTDQLDRQTFFDRAQRQLEHLRDAHPDEWRRYRAESQTWQQGTD